jgi:hypothetical protein
LSNVPYCFIPMVVFHKAGVFFEKTMNHVVGVNGG